MPNLSAATLAQVSPATAVPGYDRSRVTPGIVHIGVGGFHRAHQAVYLDSLLALDPAARTFGICGVNLLPQDRAIVDVMNDQDTLYTVLVRNPDGSRHARVVGSIVEHLFAPDDPERVLARMSDAGVRIVSLTITEGGYFYRPADDSVDLGAPGLRHDLQHPDDPRTAFGYLVAALRRRRAAGTAPFTVLSCDNVHGNGDITRRVVTALATGQDPALGAWVAEHVAFPNSMVDRITPRTGDEDRAEVTALTGLVDRWPVTCEPFTQWVLEDRFPAGRPAWESVGAQLVDDVRPYELRKLRLLNAGHLTLAYPGRLLGHRFGHQSCTDPAVRRLLQAYHAEAVTTMSELPAAETSAYCDTVVERFSNPQIFDTTDRLTTNSSASLPVFLLPVVRDLLDAARSATAAIAVVAAWARFLEGVDDHGHRYRVDDPSAVELQARAARHDEDLLAVVRDNALFDGLAGRPGFEEPYRTALGLLRSRGTRAGLDAVTASQPLTALAADHG